MRPTVIVVAIAVMATFLSHQPALAGPPEDRLAAREAGEDATALEKNSALAAKGDAPAQFAIGLIYQTGRGVTQDDAQAAVWFQKAAQQGDVRAQTALGLLYEHGRGVPRDYLEAHKWFNIAAAQLTADNERAVGVKGRDRVAPKMTPAQISEAERLASIWKPAGQQP